MKNFLLFTALCALCAGATITEEKLRSAQNDPTAWLMYGKNYSAWRYSELREINSGNVTEINSSLDFSVRGRGAQESTPLSYSMA